MAKTVKPRTNQRIKSLSKCKKYDEPFEVRDLRERAFFTVDNAFLDGRWLRILKGCPSAVYFALCRHVDKRQIAFPAVPYLADETGYGTRQIRRGIKALESHRLITVNREHLDHNIYSLLNRKHWRKEAQPVASSRYVPDLVDAMSFVGEGNSPEPLTGHYVKTLDEAKSIIKHRKDKPK